jgi:hypothetical protein
MLRRAGEDRRPQTWGLGRPPVGFAELRENPRWLLSQHSNTDATNTDATGVLPAHRGAISVAGASSAAGEPTSGNFYSRQVMAADVRVFIGEPPTGFVSHGRTLSHSFGRSFD